MSNVSAPLSRSELEAFWLPFTANRQFKAKPRLLAKASGMHYWTPEGRQILDAVAGLWCVNAGHGRREITQAVASQLETLDYAPPFQMGHPGAFALANELVKIAPDLDSPLLSEICDVCSRLADGMVCTNTTITSGGGLSGKPLFARSTEILREVRARVGPDYPLIGVGGVFSAADAKAKLDAGANLVQVYTGFIYEGPLLPSRLARELANS